MAEQKISYNTKLQRNWTEEQRKNWNEYQKQYRAKNKQKCAEWQIKYYQRLLSELGGECNGK